MWIVVRLSQCIVDPARSNQLHSAFHWEMYDVIWVRTYISFEGNRMCECIFQLDIRVWYYESSVSYHSFQASNLLGRYGLQTNKELIPFQKRFLSLSSMSDCPSQGFWLNPVDGSKILLRNVGNCDHIYIILHGVTSQKTQVFIDTSVTASDCLTVSCSLLKFKCTCHNVEYILDQRNDL